MKGTTTLHGAVGHARTSALLKFWPDDGARKRAIGLRRTSALAALRAPGPTVAERAAVAAVFGADRRDGI